MIEGVIVEILDVRQAQKGRLVEVEDVNDGSDETFGTSDMNNTLASNGAEHSPCQI